jgi:hypothetical protein
MPIVDYWHLLNRKYEAVAAVKRKTQNLKGRASNPR